MTFIFQNFGSVGKGQTNIVFFRSKLLLLLLLLIIIIIIVTIIFLIHGNLLPSCKLPDRKKQNKNKTKQNKKTCYNMGAVRNPKNST